MRPTATIEACRQGHRRLLAGVARRSDDDLRAPTLLPRFSRAHVVAHVTAKSLAHVRLLEGAAAGEVRRVHPDGYDPDAVAARGVGRTASGLHADLARALAALEAAWDILDDDHWSRHGVMAAGPRTMAEIVGHHLRNVEVHHVDLDIGYLPSDWPAELVDAELPRRLRSLPGRAPDADLLAWLLGRAPAPELTGPW